MITRERNDVHNEETEKLPAVRPPDPGATNPNLRIPDLGPRLVASEAVRPPSLPLASPALDGVTRGASHLTRIEEAVASLAGPEACLVIEREGQIDYGFFVRKQAVSAARYEHGRFTTLGLADLFHAFSDASDPLPFRVHKLEMALALALQVRCQKEPTFRSPIDMVDLDEVITRAERRGKDTVICVQRGADQHLAFVHGGQVVRAFLSGEHAALEGTPRDRLLEIGYGAPDASTEVMLFEDLNVSRSHYAGRPLQEYIKSDFAPVPFLLTVAEPGGVTQQRLIRNPEVVIGRSPECDIVLADPGVSRRHCRIKWTGTSHQIEDLGSNMGTVVDEKRLTRKQLISFGARIHIGPCTARFERETQVAREADATMVSAPSTDESSTVVPHLIIDGEAHALNKAVFRVGRAGDADLQLGGFRTKPIEAILARDPEDGWGLNATAGSHVKVEGREVTEGQARPLFSGALIEIGKHRLLFARMEPRPKAASDEVQRDIADILSQYLGS